MAVILRDTEYEDGDGNIVNRYTPVIVTGGDPLYSGSLSFAFWERYKNSEEPQKHKEAKVLAINNAIRVLDMIKADFEKLKAELLKEEL